MKDKTLELLSAIMENQQSEQPGEFAHLKATHKIIGALMKGLQELHHELADYVFNSDADEIHYFKHIKPQFDSTIIYYQAVLKIDEKCPDGPQREKEKFYEKEIKRIAVFFELNNDYYRYYRLDAEFLDHAYFLRKSVNDIFVLDEDCPVLLDSRFYTRMSYKQSLILALQKLQVYIAGKLKSLDSGHSNITQPQEKTTPFKWTYSKTAFVEFFMGLNELAVFNNRRLQLVQIAAMAKEYFGLDIGNIYKVYEDNRLKKKSRTPAIDELKNAYIRKLEHDDEFA